MKKIEFGFDNNLNPTGSWQGIGINPKVMLLDAEYIGSISIEGNNYIITKTINQTRNYQEKLFLVRNALVDLFPSGSGILYFSQNENEITNDLENLLNNPNVKDKIITVEDVLRVCSAANYSMPSFRIIESSPKIIATSILPEVFEEKNNAINNCHKTFTQIQSENTISFTR